ncbi:unnamed protein product [Allacma fusca]|uniref:Uncharacterized protein n=1 Tax=Allacma fusca TaxID=39272 RepID=A0A8J2KQ46_9HEXA|nr:unnamed protein product [Allacma fusca]
MAENNIVEDSVCKAAQTVFSIDLTLERIFQHLKKIFEDAKSSDTSVVSGCVLEISFLSSPDFPCNSIEVEGFWDLGNPSLKSFLKLFGEKINHLTISRTLIPLEIASFQMLLLDWLPSLQELYTSTPGTSNISDSKAGPASYRSPKS